MIIPSNLSAKCWDRIRLIAIKIGRALSETKAPFAFIRTHLALLKPLVVFCRGSRDDACHDKRQHSCIGFICGGSPSPAAGHWGLSDAGEDASHHKNSAAAPKNPATLRAKFWRAAGVVASQSQSAPAMLLRRVLPAARQSVAHSFRIYELGSTT